MILKKGDEIRVIAPSRSMNILSEDTINNAKTILESMGLTVTFGKNVMKYDEDYGCASIEERIDDLHEAFLDNNVKGIFTVIGGYNINQLLKYIDYDIIKNNPKVLCGFSDITALQNAIYTKTNMITFYGPHFSTFGMKKGIEYTVESMKKMLLTDEPVEITNSNEYSDDFWFIDQENRKFIKNEGMKVINHGIAEGKILGGNLCTFNLLQGTGFMPDISGSILFLEDDDLCGNVFLQEFDRNLQSIIQLPNFDKVKGIVIGRAQVKGNMDNAKWEKLITTKKELKDLPVIVGADFGHTTPIFTFPIGGKCRINTITDEVKIEIEK